MVFGSVLARNKPRTPPAVERTARASSANGVTDCWPAVSVPPDLGSELLEVLLQVWYRLVPW